MGATGGAQCGPTKRRDRSRSRGLMVDRWSPIRTAGEVVVEFVVMPRGEFVWQRVEGEARRLRGLGMTLQAIGRALGVDEKAVRNVLAWGCST